METLPLRSSFFEPPAVVEPPAPAPAAPTEKVKCIVRDVTAGATAFAIGCVFAVAAARTYLPGRFVALGVQQGAVGMVVGGLVYQIAGTQVFGVVCVPDVFVSLFFANTEFKSLGRTLVFVVASQLVLGVTLMILGKSKLLKLSEWIPSPVASGLLAGVGVCIVKMALSVEFLPACVSIFVGTLLFASSSIGLFLGILVSCVCAFHFLRWWGGMDVDAAVAAGWMVDQAFVRPSLREVLPMISFDFHVWDAIPDLCSMVLLIVLKESLQYSSMGRIVGRVDADKELRCLGYATLAVAVSGGLYCPPSLGPMILIRGLNFERSRGPAIVIIVLGFIGCLRGLAFLSFMLPTFVSSGLLFNSGLKLVHSQAVMKYNKMEPSQFLVIVAIGIAMPLVGLLPGVGLGLAASLILFAREYLAVGGIKYACDGAMARRFAERDDADDQLLRQTTHDRQYLQLQGYLFFGNAAPVLTYARLVLPHRPRSLVVDMTLVTALDASAVDVFDDLAIAAKDHGCVLRLCGLSKTVLRALNFGSIFDTALKYDDADAAIAASEDDQLTVTKRKFAFDTFEDCLALHGLKRLAFIKHRVVRLRPNDRLDGDAKLGAPGKPALYFVADGRLVLEHGGQAVATLASQTFLRRTRCGGAGRRFCIAEYGPGAVLGLEAFVLGASYYPYTALSHARLFAVDADTFAELGRQDPPLAMDLLRVCATRLAKNAQTTHEQLALLRDAFIAPANSQSVSQTSTRSDDEPAVT